jgi:DNA polymerase III delta subunit
VAAPIPFARYRQSLVRGQIDPVYVFAGEEAWFHEEGLRLLERAVIGPEARGIDREVVHGGDADLNEVVDRASTYPMGGGRRLVIVREADRLGSAGIEALKGYLASPNPRACLVFSDESFDQRKSLSRSLSAGATCVACDPVRGDAAVATFVAERLKGRGYGIAPELAEAIALGLAGAGLARLDAELDKLASSIGTPRPVSARDLEILADVPRVGDAFQAAILALRGERGEAIRSLRGLLEDGQEVPMMLGAIAWSMRTALKTRAALDRRVPPREFEPLYALRPASAEQFRALVERIPAARLRHALRLCAAADREFKGGGAKDPANALERLIHGIARAAAGTAT